MLSRKIADYKAFGYRFVVLDRNDKTIVLDSGAPFLTPPLPIDKAESTCCSVGWIGSHSIKRKWRAAVTVATGWTPHAHLVAGDKAG